MQIETKYVALDRAGLSLKSAEGQPTTLSGYASTWSALDGTGEPDSYGDLIARGAFSRTILEWQSRSYPLPMLLGHDPDKPVGTWGTMIEDAVGLRLEGALVPGHSLAKDAEAAIRHKAITGLSIGFRAIRASPGPNGTRILEEIDLMETSLVSFPANRHARLTGVKAADGVETLRDFERFLREQGWSRREAEAIAQGGFKAFLAARDGRGDAGAEMRYAGTTDRRDDGSEANRALVAALKELRGFRLTLS